MNNPRNLGITAPLPPASARREALDLSSYALGYEDEPPTEDVIPLEVEPLAASVQVMGKDPAAVAPPVVPVARGKPLSAWSIPQRPAVPLGNRRIQERTRIPAADPNAERFYQEALGALARHDYPSARLRLTLAVDFAPSEPKYRKALDKLRRLCAA